MSSVESNLIEVLKNEIENKSLACMVLQNQVGFTHTDRGVSPIVEFWSRDYLKDAIVVDKVIGKASAIFMVKGGVAYAYGFVVSELACKVFEEAGIKYCAEKIVPNIINRTGDGMCPMESAVADIEDIDKGISIILEKTC